MRFRSLSEVIRRQIEQISGDIQIPLSSPFAIQTGDQVVAKNSVQRQDGVLRWGYSAWGDDPVIGHMRPDDVVAEDPSQGEGTL